VAKTIFVFDRKGRFKNRIGRIGNGPGEYVSLYNVAIVAGINQIAVFDKWKNSIHFFNINGNFIRSEQNLISSATHMEYLPSGYRVFDVTSLGSYNAYLNEYQNNTLVVTNTVNEVMYGACTDFYTPGQFQYVMNLPLRKFGENVYYSPNFSNLIYQVGDSCLTAKYHINIKDGMPPFTKDITNAKFKDLTNKYTYFSGDILEMKDMTFIKLSSPIENPISRPIVFYSHANKQVYYTKEEYINPLYDFVKYADTKAMYNENTIVVDVNAYRVRVHKLVLFMNEKSIPQLDELSDSLLDDDNPVLFFYKLKTNLM
jgi:hypothetical protein